MSPTTVTGTVLSGDKRFIVVYPLSLRASPHRHVIIKGDDFAGRPGRPGCWSRVRTPEWPDGDAVTPSFVRRLIEWSLDPALPRVEVSWTGEG
jgi:hypothetical protein